MVKSFLLLSGAMACSLLSPETQAQSLSINATITGEVVPGVYGQVVIGSRPPPPVVYAQPVLIQPVAVAAPVEPIYLHVPPGHARHWRQHCAEYNACDRPVYFVRSAEYEPDYHPRKAHHDEEHGHGDEHERHGDKHGHHDEERGHDD